LSTRQWRCMPAGVLVDQVLEEGEVLRQRRIGDPAGAVALVHL
jgi:hypothetical protein